MKNKLWIIALMALIGFSMAACGDGGDSTDPLNGTWKAGDGGSITLTNGSFVIAQNNKQGMRGTYTSSARSISANLTMAVKEVHGDYLEEIEEGPTFESKWYNKSQVTDAFRKWMKEENPSLTDTQISAFIADQSDEFEAMFPTKTAAIDGDTMTCDGTTYTKNGGTTPGTNPGTGNMTWTAVSNSTFGTSSINALVYANGKFIAGGYDKKMAYSSDGVNWTAVPNSTFTSGFISAIAYGDNKFVAGNSGGKMATSPDGINWTAVPQSSFSDRIRGIVWDNNMFVAVADSGKIATSPDGVNWTQRTNSTFTSGDTIYKIAFGGGKFVAVGSVGKMAYSTDGETWTTVTDSKLGPDRYIDEIAYGNGMFVAGGYVNKSAYSTDGTNWTANSFSINTLAFGNGKFVSASRDHTEYSTDGVTWTRICGKINAFTGIIFRMAYGSNKFVAVSSDGEIAYLSGN